MERKELVLPKYGRGFHLITDFLEGELDLSGVGVAHVFMLHTSAGLTVNEAADPDVRIDFETIFNKLVPEGDKDYVHTAEGLDDMPAHVKSSLVGCSVFLPFEDGKFVLGLWQGVFLCEFRNAERRRRVLVTLMKA